MFLSDINMDLEHIVFTLLLILLAWIYINCFPSFHKWKYDRKRKRKEAKELKKEVDAMHQYYYEHLREQNDRKSL